MFLSHFRFSFRILTAGRLMASAVVLLFGVSLGAAQLAVNDTAGDVGAAKRETRVKAPFWSGRGTAALRSSTIFSDVNDEAAVVSTAKASPDAKDAADGAGAAECSTVVIRKEVVTPDGTGASTVGFGFSATPNFGVTSFTLVDDNSGPGQDFTSTTLSVAPGTTATLTVNETTYPRGWTLINVDCVENMTQDSTRNSVGPATINLQAGETVICTFTNSGLGVTAAPASVSGQVRTDTGTGIEGARLTLRNLNTGEVRTTLTNNFGSYTFNEVMTDDEYLLEVSSKGHEFANSQVTFTLRDNVSDMDFIASTQRASLSTKSSGSSVTEVAQHRPVGRGKR